jgi:WD40 repeat protein/uncharacterized caspase-like protein
MTPLIISLNQDSVERDTFLQGLEQSLRRAAASPCDKLLDRLTRRVMTSSGIALCVAALVRGAFTLFIFGSLSLGAPAQTQSQRSTTNNPPRSREAKPELVLQTGNNSSLGVARLVFSPDGRLVATATLHSGIVKLWETATGRELRDVTSANQVAFGTAPFVAFSKDNRLIATASGDNSIKIWDLISGREQRTFVASPEHSTGIHFIAFGANDRTLVAVSDAILVWDLATGRELRLASTVLPLSDRVGSVTLSRDSRQLALIVPANSGSLVKTFDLSSGSELQSLNLPDNSDSADLSFTPEGKLLVSGVSGKRLRLWDMAANQRDREFGQTQDDSVLEFNNNGNLLAVSEGERVRIFDATKGREVAVLKVSNSDVSLAPNKIFVSFSDDGKKVATGGLNAPTVLWETKTGKQLLKLNGRTNRAYNVAFSEDGTRLSSGGRTVWDLRSGRGLRLVSEQTEKTIGFPSPDGQMLAVGQPNSGLLTILETQTGRRVQTLSAAPDGEVVQRASFSRDGTRLVAICVPSEGQTKAARSVNHVKIWDVKQGRELHTLPLAGNGADAVWSRDGRMLATVDGTGNIALWDVSSGRKLRDVSRTRSAGTAIAFSPDGLTLALNQGGDIVLWDTANDRERGVLKGRNQSITNVTFSRDGQSLAASSGDNLIHIWDVTAQRELVTLVGHTANINSIDFSPDSHLIASASDDGSTFLWDTYTGEQLLTLISLDDGGEWVVVTPQGVFDGTPSSWNQILWRYNQDTFNVAPIEWFFNEFYYPGLLADIFAGKRPHVAEDVSRKDRRQPLVKLSLVGDPPPEGGVSSRSVRIKIEITDAPPDKDNPQGTGARDLRLFRNGSLVKVWPGDVLKGKSSVTLEQKVAIKFGVNRLSAYAFNKDNVKSKDALLPVRGAESLSRAGTVYIIAVGINSYANTQYNLKYAVADAQSFSEELRRRLPSVARFDRIEVVPLINETATKANILAALQRLAGSDKVPGQLPAFARLKQAMPEDTVVVYFAGHGTAQAQRFYLVPHDLGYMGQRTTLDEQGLRTILSHSISDLELAQAVEGMDAGHLVLFVDACNSGQALEAEEKRLGPMNSKGLAQLAYEKGMYILTAAESYQAALEASQLGHGLLTYALVEEGLKTASADREPKDGLLTAKEWLDFASERVPQVQAEKMKQSRGIGLELAFAEGEQNIADPQKRSLQRPRAFYRRELEADPLIVSATGANSTSRSAIAIGATPGGPTSRGILSRWIDLQTATLGIRYRFVENSQGATVANQLQSHVQFKARFKFDKSGNYSLNAGVFTGGSFVLGFNDTGIGTGDAITNLYLKQLYFSAKPINGVEVQFGGLYFNRGESTEITTYDNDGFLMGERVVVQRPHNFFFDEISATYAFLGDLTKANINQRWHGLKESNYHQFLVSKRIGERAVVSTDYTFQADVDTLRQALRVKTPELKVVDFVRVELYQRVNHHADAGLAAYGEKSFLKKRLAIGGGYAQIDPNYGGLNADRFNIGRRFFFNGSYKLSPEFTVSTFYTHAFNNDFPLNSRTRFEIFFTYSLLKSLQKAGLF